MAAGSPELRLGVSFDLQNFKTVALPSLVQAASSFDLTIGIKFDRTSINEEMRLLGRQLGQRKYRIDLDDTSIKSAIAQVDKLAGKLSGVRGSAEKARALGGVISTAPGAGGPSAQQVQSIFGAAKELGIVKGAADRTRKELVAELKTGFALAGEEAMAGLIQGILKGEGQLQGVAASLGAKLLQALEQSLEIRSPSRKMRRIGQQAGQGFNDGLIASLQEATRNAVALVNASLRKLDRVVELRQRKARAIAPGQPGFELAQREAGVAMGRRERVQNQAEVLQLRGAAGQFEGGSYQALSKLLQSLQIEASEIKPNTPEWNNLQQRIAQVNLDLQRAGKLAEEIQMRKSLEAYSPGSLASLESRLVILKSRAREIAPDTTEWKALNREIQKAERLAEKADRKPITKGQRLGAAGGAFLYGGGMGGGVGSALGGVAGGLLGGVPGAFTGAAIGQVTDSVLASVSAMTTQASALMQMQRGLALASIDAKDFAEAQSTVASMSQRLLMPLEQTTRLFTQLRVNTKQYNLSVKDTAEIMEGTALAIMATGGSADDLEGAMRAVVQIMSKGGVQAEELRGQLGERFPGAVVKFAQANKLSFEGLQKGLEEGSIGIREFVNFAKKNYTDYADFSQQLATAPEFAGKRLQIAFEQLQLAIGQALGPAGADIQNFSTQAIKDITKFIVDNKDLLSQLGKDFAVTFAGIASVVSETAKFITKALGPVLSYIADAIRQLRVMAGAADAATAKAEMDAANAIIQRTGMGRDAFVAGKGLTTPGAYSDKIEFDKAQERLARAEKRFKAAGGFAALPTGRPQNLTFGGPGAGMSLDRLGKSKDSKSKRIPIEEIMDYESQRAMRLKASNMQLALDRKIAAAKMAGNDAEAESLESLRGILKINGEIAELETFRNMLIDKETQLIDKTFTQKQWANKLQDANVKLDELRNDLQSEYLKLQLSERDQRKKAEEELSKRIEKQLQLNRLIEDAAIAAGVITPDEARKRAQQREFDDQFLRAKELGATPEQLVAIKDFQAMTPQAGSIQEKLKLLREELEKLASTQETVTFSANAIGEAFANSFKSIISGASSAQQALGSFFQSIADAFLDMAAQMIKKWVEMQIIGLAQNLLSPLGGGLSQIFGAGASSFNPAAFSGPALSPGGGFGAGGAPSFSSVFSGGQAAFNPSAFSMPRFANGGIVTGPTLGLVGEGRYNEAIIPMPNGKSVPVELGGAMGSPITSNIVVNVSSDGKTSSSNTGSDSAGLGRRLEGAVKQVIVDELRPGGLLSGRR